MLKKIINFRANNERPPGNRFETIGFAYSKFAVLLLNTLLIIVFLNIFAWLGIALWNGVENEDIIQRLHATPPVSMKKTADLHQVYPEYSSEQIGNLLNETWSRPYVFESFTQFKESPYTGEFVNVSNNGYRETATHKPWPPNNGAINVFLFGGSTMFGYGVADNQTVSSYLEEYLDRNFPSASIRVYNFGRGGYYSSQEVVLFIRLLSEKHIPNLAIFVDGLNEFAFPGDKPFYSDEFNAFVELGYTGQDAKMIINNMLVDYLPAYRLGDAIKTYADKHNNFDKKLPYEKISDKDIARVISKYINNKKIIEAVATNYNIKTLFVWQPVPTYKYDLKYHPFIPQGFGTHTNSKYGYPEMKEYLDEYPPNNNFVWAADLQKDYKEPLYVDKVHYSPKMSKILAEYIGDSIKQKKIIIP